MSTASVPTLPEFAIVVAADEALGIGKEGALPWRLPGELAYFKRITSSAAEGRQNAVLMGRKTYASIAPKYRPLAHRLNVVLSRDPHHSEPGTLGAHSLEHALSQLAQRNDIDRVFVIGGGELYQSALAHPRCQRVYLTRVHARFDCDTWLPAFESGFSLLRSDGPHHEGDLSYTFEVYERAD